MDIEQLVQQLERDTEALLALARAGHWEQFMHQEEARLALVKQLEQIDIESAEQAAALRDALIRIRQTNEELATLAESATTELVKQKQALNKGRQMKNAYKST